MFRHPQGASKGNAMKLADFVPKGKMSLADAAKRAGLLAVCDPFAWFCLFLALGGLFGHSWKAGYIGLVAILCGGPGPIAARYALMRLHRVYRRVH
jgi:hypothetical protein